MTTNKLIQDFNIFIKTRIEKSFPIIQKDMSLKYTILNMSYEKKSQTLQNHKRTPNRYNIVGRSSDFQKQKLRAPTPDDKYFQKEQIKESIYQKYKKSQYYKKLKLTLQSDYEKYNTQNIMVRGYVKQPQKIVGQPVELQPQRMSSSLNPKRQNFMSSPRKKPQTSQSNRIQNAYSQKFGNAIGILGVKTSFIDKFKLKYQSNQTFRTISPDLNDFDAKTKRRQLLCSRNAYRTLQVKPWSKNSTKLGNSETFTSQNKNKQLQIPCRPWSPTRDQEFQRI